MLGFSLGGRVAVVAALLAVTACSGDGGSDAGAESSESASGSASAAATPSASPSEADTASDAMTVQEQLAVDRPERPQARNTPASREAFARYVMDSWAYALGTNNAKAVTALSARGRQCEGCPDLTAELAKRKKQGWFVGFPGLEVHRVVIRPDAAVPGAFVATAKVDIPASRSYFEDGSYRNDNAAHKNTAFVIGLRRAGPRFVLLSYQVG